MKAVLFCGAFTFSTDYKTEFAHFFFFNFELGQC